MDVQEKINAGNYKNKLSWSGGREQQDAHNREERRLLMQFRADVLAELDLTGHPKAELLWNMAWTHGHADGLSDVLYWAKEFAQLVR